MPRSQVIGLVTAIIVVAAAIIAFVALRRPAAPATAPSGPAASAQATPAPLTSQAPPAPATNTPSTNASTGADNLLQPTGDTAWKLEQTQGGAGSLASEGDVLHVTVTRAARKYWHVQFYQTPAGLQPNQAYTLTFRAKADSPCDLPTGGSINYGDYHPIGLTTHFTLGRDWKTYSHTFLTQSFTGPVRLPVFMVGTKPHQYWLSDVVLTKASR